jgi:cystinosin
MKNFVRKTTIGFNTDKLLYDLIGFGCLSVYCYSFRYIHSVRDSYRDKHGGTSPSVELNDVAFGIHAFFMTLVQIAQVLKYNGLEQKPSMKCLIGCGVTVLAIVVYLVVCLLVDSSVFVVLNWLYFISFVKIGVTLIKYVPQVLLNNKRYVCVSRCDVSRRAHVI